MKKETKQNNSSPRRKKIIRTVSLALIIIAAVLLGIFMSDFFFKESTSAPSAHAVTITISGKDIFIDGTKKVGISSLKLQLDNCYDEYEKVTIALINDFKNPADTDTYNSVAALLEDYNIHIEPLTEPASIDEAPAQTATEIQITTASSEKPQENLSAENTESP